MAVDTEELADLKDERRANIGAVQNHCPYGCTHELLDEYGYCEHLIGFTNDPRVGGVVELIEVHPVTEFTFVNGRNKRKRNDTQPPKALIEHGDKFVNPEEVQVVNGVRNVAKLWVSSRVYRKNPKKKAS